MLFGGCKFRNFSISIWSAFYVEVAGGSGRAGCLQVESQVVSVLFPQWVWQDVGQPNPTCITCNKAMILDLIFVVITISIIIAIHTIFDNWLVVLGWRYNAPLLLLIRLGIFTIFIQEPKKGAEGEGGWFFCRCAYGKEGKEQSGKTLSFLLLCTARRGRKC